MQGIGAAIKGIDSKARTLIGFIFVMAILAVVVFVATGVNFFSAGNLRSISRGLSILGVAALGQAVVIISGGLDLSVSAVISTSNVLVAAIGSNGGFQVFVGIAVSILFGAGIGLINGLMVAKRRVPPFIATLGVSIMINGIRLMATQGIPEGTVPGIVRKLGTGLTLGIPNLVYLFVVILALFFVLLHRTVYGRMLFAVGVNEQVGRYVGLRTDRVVILSYVACSVNAAVAGIMLAGYTGMADQNIGSGYELDTIAAAVIGGSAIGGGSGSALGTIGGVAVMLLITNLMLLLTFPQQSQMLIKGIVLILALWIDGLSHSKKI